MVKFLGSALDIPAATTATQAVRKSYVDSGDATLAARIATLENNSGSTLKTRNAASAVTAVAGDFILADTTGGAFTVTLPSNPPKDSPVGVKKVDSLNNLVTVVGQGGAKIDGDTSLSLLQAQSGAILVFDGSNWRVESTVIFDPGEKNFTYRGDWATAVDYGINDVVYYQASSYLAKQSNNSQAPTVDATDATWGLLAHGVNGSFGYTHTQSTPATVWQISHGLGYDPGGVTVISADGDTMDDAVIQYMVSGQSLRLSFDISFAGTAYLS